MRQKLSQNRRQVIAYVANPSPTLRRRSQTHRKEVSAICTMRQICDINKTISRLAINKTDQNSHERRETLARMSHDCRETLVRISRDCRETVARMSRDCRDSRANVSRLLYSRETLARMSHDCRETLARMSHDCCAIVVNIIEYISRSQSPV